MKQIVKLLLSISIFSILLTLTGCFDPIFYEIRKDVKPEKATVSGNIPTITRYKDYLVVSADQGLRYKHADNETHGSWSTYSLPFDLPSFNFDNTTIDGQQLISVIANSDTLYILSVEYSTTGADGMSVPSKVNLWGKQIDNDFSSAGDWVLISEKTSKNLFPVSYNKDTGVVETSFNLFQTNSPMNAHRHAYVCTYDSDSEKYKYYELNGTNAPVEITVAKTEDSNADSENTDPATLIGRAYSAVYYQGEIKFFISTAVTTDETYTKEANRIYYGDDSTLFSITGTTKHEIVELPSKISSIATCADAIIVGKGAVSEGGGGGGLARVRIVDGQPEESVSEFETNASFQISEAYLVIALLNATPERNETDSALYAAITFFNKNGVYNNIGLWSYYPGRGNWNRE